MAGNAANDDREAELITFTGHLPDIPRAILLCAPCHRLSLTASAIPGPFYAAQPVTESVDWRTARRTTVEQMPEKNKTVINDLNPLKAGTQLQHATLQGLSITGLEDMQFDHCTFVECSFSSAECREVRFARCRFYDADTETGTSFRFANLRGCRFDHCDLTLADLSRSGLYQSEFSGCQLTGCQLNSATSCHLIGGNVELSEATFADCNLAYANLTGVRMPGTDFSASRMSHVQLERADLTGAILTDCELHQAEGAGMILRDTDLRGALISGLDIREIDLAGARIGPVEALPLLEAIGLVID